MTSSNLPQDESSRGTTTQKPCTRTLASAQFGCQGQEVVLFGCNFATAAPYDVAVATALHRYERRGRDSNPRYRLRGTTVFETAPFNHSGTPP
jgi:hypothetical protein